ncbi:MAG: TIGR03619 family F420-dependent LLM class oxidoreductase [Actinobacteria bacterium]|nr:TIGR03619 family F420-dependent LLM class oxidoreductase [Actinomycetota bacterium]
MTSPLPRYGIQLPIQAQSALFAQAWEADATPDHLATIARAADDAGFAYVGVCDHVAIPERLADTMHTTWYDQIATLGWLAAVTTRTRLLSHVHIAAYRHPAQSAHAFATLDHLSGGRVIIGVGAGHVAEEFALLGVEFERRGAVLDEHVAMLKRYLEDEFVDGMGAGPRPVQDPRPPIWIGGSSPAAIRRAALTGDGWLPQGPPPGGMRATIATIHQLRSRHGLDGTFTIGALTPFLRLGATTGADPDGTIAGSPDRLAEMLIKLAGIGVTDIQVRFAASSVADHVDQLHRFGTEVAPLIG